MPREEITTTYTEEEFKNLLKSIVAEAIKEIEQSKPLTPPIRPEKIFLSRIEAAKMLGISLPTLNARSVDGTIPYGRLGRKIYYKFEDIELSLMAYKKKGRNK